MNNVCTCVSVCVTMSGEVCMCVSGSGCSPECAEVSSSGI